MKSPNIQYNTALAYITFVIFILLFNYSDATVIHNQRSSKNVFPIANTHIQPASRLSDGPTSLVINNQMRYRRQVELMDLDDPRNGSGNPNVTQEDEGFWGRVVRVALNLLKRFMNWLNE